ncbi:TetR/AcrR family transcriptional regulator [Vagococcus xieshaowenii]|uniref:TetR/AcrR family transcriptional regulator n=1 Tax=Vagococcus xieshaowenii TaxID=2562451 RepID=A0AAJ5JL08_9ENTE|nr:TetR/AcrR family transcriptional regulator [Vagococcus xieshaowenii]QCA29129.1 TetR/AcrR family transcriptional regulator [Vagococcus xieshaowenii]TFZ40894.1 TetR/AcrR family transcriptional regulator [Vagococcus xieshaowenii]
MKITDEDIYRASRELLLIGGYDYLTFAKLSQNLDVTRPALYKHFQTKDELILSMMEAEMTVFLEDLPEIAGNQPTDSLDILLRKFLAFADVHRLLESVYRIDYDTRRQFPEKMLKLKKAHEQFKHYLDQLIDEGKEQQVFERNIPNEWIVNFFMNAIHMVEDRDSCEEIEIVKQLLMNGVGKR